jgi:hypothetical protein
MAGHSVDPGGEVDPGARVALDVVEVDGKKAHERY